ncbi:MAG: arsenite methyltransferase [Anaerolineae bacterium]|nr:arsenite methyltransferase [Anaerolineae bacterium]
MTMTNASRRYFEETAAQWDTLRAGYFGEEVRQAAIERAYLRADMTAADVGAGTGFIAAGLAPLVRQVHVIDGSAAMLEVARKNLADYPSIVYHHAEGLALPLEDQSVDVVFANMYLHHCPDPLAAIREMARILKPGGRLVITDVDAHTHTWMREEMADVWLGFARPQVRAWLREAGLVNVIVDCTGETCCAAPQESAPALEEEHRAQISVFVAVGTRRAAMRETVRQAYGAIAEAGCGCGLETSPSASCCGEAQSESHCCESVAGYTPAELAAAPQEAADFALGCGNPLALAGLRRGETVLDIGSGGGLDSFLAARRVGEEGRVIGVDMTPAMLARARAAARKAGIRNVEFRRGQAEALPLEDQSVDVVLSNCVINLCEDKGQVFAEAFRVLKPGGRLEVSDMVAGGSFPPQVRTAAGEWAACLAGALPEGEYLDLIAQAGFEDIRPRRGGVSETLGGVEVYALLVSARKPGGTMAETAKASSCGCKPGCCG